MTQSLSDKMQSIATHVNDLSAAGKVKAMTKNEKGYAKLFSINSGCKVWIHHTLDDKLILDLMVTKKGQFTSPDVVKYAIATFSHFAKETGHFISQRPWRHSIKETDIREQYYFEVTNERVVTIIALIDKVGFMFQKFRSGSTTNS